jgi:hypothetical protein
LNATAPGAKAAPQGTDNVKVLLRINTILAEEYPLLRTYLGESAFRTLSLLLASVLPPASLNARWLSQNLPRVLMADAKWRRHPEVNEFASLEQAMNAALRAVDLRLEALSRMPSNKRANTVFSFHPSVHRLRFLYNTTSIWSALKCEERTPAPHALETPQCILVWRQGSTARFRMIGAEELTALEGLGKGLTLAKISQSITSEGDMQTVSAKTEAYLREWTEAGLLLAELSASQN